MSKRYYIPNTTIDPGKDFDYELVVTSGGTPYWREKVNSFAGARKCDHLPMRFGVAISGPDETEFFLSRNGLKLLKRGKNEKGSTGN